MFKVHLIILDFNFKERTEEFFLFAFCCFVFDLKWKTINAYVENPITFVAVNKLNVIIVVKIFTFILRL